MIIVNDDDDDDGGGVRLQTLDDEEHECDSMKTCSLIFLHMSFGVTCSTGKRASR